MRMITLEYLKAIDACYWVNGGDPKKAAYVEARLPATPLEVAEFDLPPEDLLWLFLREDFIPADELRWLARQFALAVVDKWDCPPIVRQWLETGDESIRSAADVAAYSVARAAYSAAYSAARAAADSAADVAADSVADVAAYSVAKSAAYSAAKSAAWAVADSAAYSVAHSAADAEARAAQLELVKEKLREVAK